MNRHSIAQVLKTREPAGLRHQNQRMPHRPVTLGSPSKHRRVLIYQIPSQKPCQSDSQSVTHTPEKTPPNKTTMSADSTPTSTTNPPAADSTATPTTDSLPTTVTTPNNDTPVDDISTTATPRDNGTNNEAAAVDGEQQAATTQDPSNPQISAPTAPKSLSRPTSALSSNNQQAKNLTIHETMNPNTPDEYLKRYKDAFNMFANKEGRVPLEPDLPILIRGLLKNPTTKQLNDWLKQLEVSPAEGISLDEFLCIMRQKSLQDVDAENDLKECFRMFDKQSNGFMNVAQFRNILQNVGDRELNDEEIEEMIRESQDSENPQWVMYGDHIEQMLGNIQPLVPLKKQKKGRKGKKKK